jgi:hypothetical protein
MSPQEIGSVVVGVPAAGHASEQGEREGLLRPSRRGAQGQVLEVLATAPVADLAGLYEAAVATHTGESRATSVRVPLLLHEAAHRLVELGGAESFSALLVDGLRMTIADAATLGLQSAAAGEALEAHYRDHPDDRPSMAEIVHAEAQITGHPAADRPDLIEAAVAALGADAYVEELLAWAAGALATEQRLAAKPRRTKSA